MEPYKYLDYRTYLRALLDDAKQQKFFSFRYFARMAGFSSPSYLKMVIDGQRNLTTTSIHQCARAFKLGERESAYFEALVLMNQAKADREKSLYFERLIALRPTTALTGLSKDQFEYFTQKHFVAIREMVALPHFQEDSAWIAKSLRFPVKIKDIEHAINVLLRLGLLVRRADEKLTQADVTLTTPPEVTSVELMRFHRAMLDDAKEALFTVAAPQRDVSALTIPIPKGQLPWLKKRIQQFREELLEAINRTADYEEVYQLNVQLFPLTKSQ